MSDSGAGIFVPRNFEPALGVLSYTCRHPENPKNTRREFDNGVEAIFDSTVCAARASDRIEIPGFGGFRTSGWNEYTLGNWTIPGKRTHQHPSINKTQNRRSNEIVSRLSKGGATTLRPVGRRSGSYATATRGHSRLVRLDV